jgi:type II secretory pathway predicted ATPase ExeA
LYEAFFGFREQPFALTTDPRFLFMSAAHRRAYEELLTGLRRREGLLVLTGDTGMGKTTLCRAVIDALGARTFSALILNPYMSDAEIVRVILRDFGLVSRDDIRKGAFAKADMPQLLDTLEQFLRSLVALNSYAVVIIDEAQNLSPRVLDQIRVLGNYEHEGQRLLQIILVGQPQLVTTLRSEALRAVDERVSRRAVLGPLPPAEIDLYIQHRLAIAGGRDSVGFPSESVHLIAELTRGVPRRINLLCDQALEQGRIAGTSSITPALIQRAARLQGGQAASEPVVVAPSAPPADAGPPAAAFDALDLGAADVPLDHEAEQAFVDRSLSFGQVDEPPSSARWGLRVVLALAVLVVIGAAYAAWAVVNGDPGVPMLPEPPPRRIEPASTNLFPPGYFEERHVMRELERTLKTLGGG